ncbi:MAG: ATP-binding protein [Saccharofermentanales bacterium]
MKINKVNINNFGKLKDFQLSFENGFNLIYGENEQGKSTIMAFIRMMLYGTVNRTADLGKNLRKKYAPWDGSKMSGSLEFTHDGLSYRLEKTFGATPVTDVVKLWNTTTNNLELLSQNKEIGKRFLGMGEEAFEKSVFIGQISSVINSDKDKDHEIIQKLQNLVSSGDETKSFDDIESRINTALEKLKAKRGKIGILDRLLQKASELEESRFEAISVEDRKSQMQKDFQGIIEKKEMTKTRLSEKAAKLEEMKNFQIFCDLEKIIAKDMTLGNLRAEAEKADGLITKGDFKADPVFLDEAQKFLNELTEMNAILLSKEDELAEKKKALEKFDGLNPDNLSKEIFDSLSELNSNIRNETDLEKNKLMALQSEEFAYRTAVAYEDASQKNSAKIQEYKERAAGIRSDIEKIASPADTDYKNDDGRKGERSGKPGIALYPWVLSFIVFIAAGIFISPFLYIGSLLSILIPAFIWSGRIRAAKRLKEADLTKPSGDYESRRNVLSSDLAFTEKQMDEIIASQELLIKENAQLRPSNEIDRSCGDIRESIETIRQSISDKKRQIQNEFIKFHVDSFDKLQQKYFEIQNEYARRNDLTKEIELKQNSLAALRNDFEMKKTAFFGYFSKIKNVATLQDALESLDVLTRQYYDAQHIRSIVMEKERELLASLNSRNIDEIRIEYESLKDKYTADDEKDTDSVKSIEAEIDRLKSEISQFDISLARMKSEMTHAFSDKPELAIIEDEISKNRQMIDACQMQYDALSITKKQMEKAFLEMQQSFGPKVNDKTAGIFSEITDGKYNDLLISRDLNISFRDPSVDTTQDWQYLSGGTIDQVYFSLRLAISEFIAEDLSSVLPLFIDDAFLQYDDARTERSLSFLIDYSKTRESQIIFFTCHQSILKMVEISGCPNITILK